MYSVRLIFCLSVCLSCNAVIFLLRVDTEIGYRAETLLAEFNSSLAMRRVAKVIEQLIPPSRASTVYASACYLFILAILFFVCLFISVLVIIRALVWGVRVCVCV